MLLGRHVYLPSLPRVPMFATIESAEVARTFESLELCCHALSTLAKVQRMDNGPALETRVQNDDCEKSCLGRYSMIGILSEQDSTSIQPRW